MTERGCDNCYYSYFDEKAYPCSLCIRGIERTDQWQPSKKTKQRAVDIIESILAKDEPTISKMEQVDKDINVRSKTMLDCYKCRRYADPTEPCVECRYEPKTEPQTEETCERCVYVRGSQWCQGCNGTPKKWDGKKIVDATQNERSE